VPYEPYRYEPDSYLDLPKLAGIEIAEIPPLLKPSVEALKVAEEKLGNATVGVQPGARHPWKRIPIPVLASVVRDLHRDQSVVLLGGPEEKEFGEQLEAELEVKPLNLIGAFSLKESIAAVSKLRLMIGGDTGLMHIAAASGTPTVGLFGPTQASRYAPWGARTAVAQTAIPALDLYGPDFDHRTTGTMMDSLSVEAAEATARALWRSSGGAAA
jgi:ADP-heptose:LPS heptosyltransferase